MANTEAARQHARAQANIYRQQLHELLRIRSVSADSQAKGEVQRAAEWLKAEMERIGVQNVTIYPTKGQPIVYGEWLGAGQDAPTVLVYGHYDVQPAHKSDGTVDDGWLTDPFEPIERDGYIYCRGSTDDKGQLFTHLKAFESYMQAGGGPPVNVKFLFEGEEEVSSPNLRPFIEAHQDLLRADVTVISDGAMTDPDEPAITYSVRGMTYMEIHVTGPSRDLHSGSYGGAVHNPALALVQILSKMHNADNSVAVPGFYDDVVPLTAEEREALKASDLPDQKLLAETGAPAPWGEAGYTTRERIGARPTLEINGLVSGYTGEGPKTVLPSKAMAKVSCRLVANQNPQRIYELVKTYVAQITPPTVRSEVRLLALGDPAMVDINAPEMQAAARAYTRGWGQAPSYVREGGSLPVVADINRILGIPVILMGYGLTSDGPHGPNERFMIDMFHKGIDTNICFLEEISQLKR